MSEEKWFNSISTFDQLENLSEKYEKTFGFEPFNLSYWDPSDDFSKKMLPLINLNYPQNAINYIFTYQIEELKNQLLVDLGFDSDIKDAIITPNGTTSIMMAVHWIKMKGYHKLNVISPSYFSLLNNCEKENIRIVRHNVDYITGNFCGINPIKYTNEVFWLTNPIYSLGHHIISRSNLDIIEHLLENNLIIVDDCVAHKHKELSRFYGNDKNFIGIYAPHKSVCVNGIKFSIIVFNKEYESFFDQSIDFLCGGINTASVAAINNYLDGGFDIYRDKFQKYIKETHVFVKSACNKVHSAYYNNPEEHYLTSICFPHIPYELGQDRNFLWNIMDNTGAAFIPGHFNSYPEESGFSFRINMARDSAQFRATLTRLLLFLAQQSNLF